MEKIFLIEKVSLKKSESIWEKFKEIPIIPKPNKFVWADNIEEAMEKCGLTKSSFVEGYMVLSGSAAIFKLTELTEQTKPLRP